ncbi:MAG: DUF4982 domain-containing protein [Opitutales bacterium]|nr:DUF4982 domain-containing protein [Opitutales bacterium]
MSIIRSSITFMALFSTTALHADRCVTLLDDGWQFNHGEASPAILSPAFDATSWESVTLPHDWAIGGAFNIEEHGSTGKLPWKDVACYRKMIRVDAADQGKRFYLDFDGVMAFPKIYLNGELISQWDYGYTPFRVDLTDHLKFDVPNILVVEVDPREWNSRWYPGAGIYRKVQLVTCEPMHIARWGTFVQLNHPQSLDSVKVETVLENFTGNTEDTILQLQVLNAEGVAVQTVNIPVRLHSGMQTNAQTVLSVPNPVAWDVDNPYLYTLKSTLKQGDAVLDSSETRFGLRSIQFTADDGFILNGRRVQFKGVNLHHDLGPLGAAFNKRAAQRQLEIMKSMGVNALRTSHNPPASEVLDLCDEMGILVWDEAFDKWDGTAGRRAVDDPPLEPYGKRHLESYMLRDRNHPSVIVWSVGNEIPPGEMGITPENVETMVRLAKELDTSRPIGMGCHIPSLSYGGNFDSLDLTGWNYARRYMTSRSVYPEKPIIYSESASALSTRGFYSFPLDTRHTDYLENLQVSSYDLTAAPWSDIVDVEFDLMEKDSFVQGEFVWAGIDYLGEPTPYDAQSRSSYFGPVDLCGFPKDRYYLYRSHWLPEEKTIHILPHWNWPDRVGQKVPVFVYTNGDSAELFLNGKSLGMRHKGDVPPRPENMALKATATVSSTAPGTDLSSLTDGNNDTLWMAAQPGGNQWAQLDFGRPVALGYVGFNMMDCEKYFAYTLSASVDGENWEPLAVKGISELPLYGGADRVFHTVDIEAQFLRIEFTGTDSETRTAGIRNVYAYAEPCESDYYDVTYKYRLRWNDVTYEPGELKVVAYKDGKVLGEETVQTAGDPAQVALTADRTMLSADGADLAFITVEVTDKAGIACPTAQNKVQFSVTGPAVIAGVGNGNPQSFEPFQVAYRNLFNGKALLIVRTQKGQSGKITVKAVSEGLKPVQTTLQAQ